MRLSISINMLNKWHVAFAFFFLRGSFIFSQDVEGMSNRERRAHAISLESYSDFLIKQSGYWTSEINGCKYELSQLQKDIELIQSDNEAADRSYDQLKKSIAENESRAKKLKKDIEFQKYVVDSLRFTAEAPICDLSATNVGDRFNGALVIEKTQNSVLLSSLSPIGSGSWDEAAALARNYKFGFCWWRLPSPTELELIFSMRDRLDSFENNWYWTDNAQGNMAEHIGISEGDHALVPKGHGKCVFAVTIVEGINGTKQDLTVPVEEPMEEVEAEMPQSSNSKSKKSKAPSYVSFASAQRFVERSIASLEGAIIDGYTNTSMGAEIHTFLVSAQGSVCVIAVSEYALEVLASDCGGDNKIYEYYNAKGWN
jgi:hypothetical protein